MTELFCLMFGSEAFSVFFFVFVFFLVSNPVCAAKLKRRLSKSVFFFSVWVNRICHGCRDWFAGQLVGRFGTVPFFYIHP